jgi:hypothetical protein
MPAIAAHAGLNARSHPDGSTSRNAIIHERKCVCLPARCGSFASLQSGPRRMYVMPESSHTCLDDSSPGLVVGLRLAAARSSPQYRPVAIPVSAFWACSGSAALPQRADRDRNLRSVATLACAAPAVLIAWSAPCLSMLAAPSH